MTKVFIFRPKYNFSSHFYNSRTASDEDIQDYKSFDFERKISSKQAILGLNVSFFA